MKSAFPHGSLFLKAILPQGQRIAVSGSGFLLCFMSGEDRIIGKRYSHFLKGNLLDPFHLVIGSSKWFTENCWVGGTVLDTK
jgi:hypothetical protein